MIRCSLNPCTNDAHFVVEYYVTPDEVATHKVCYEHVEGWKVPINISPCNEGMQELLL